MSWNWIVTVETDNAQIITVPVSGYINVKDAMNAALSQTGAKRVLNINPDADADSNDDSLNKQSYYLDRDSNEIGEYYSYYDEEYDEDGEPDIDLTEAIILILSAVVLFLSIIVGSDALVKLFVILIISFIIHIAIRKFKEDFF